MKKALIGTAVVVVVIAGAYYTLLSDEPPIRVRNGSIEIHAGNKNGKQWRWQEENDRFSHEPETFELDTTRRLWVKVETEGEPGSTTYKCETKTDDDNKVIVSFLSDNETVDAEFKRVGSWLLNQRTKVTPKRFTLNADRTMLTSAGAGYVTKVEAGDVKCEFYKYGHLKYIDICMSSSDPFCQP